ncbi:ABC transporter ATP-binding protein [Oceanithermus desulfurans]|uniref:ABC transporter domain-containing protein n=2 Tax=Oceanithermus desulfurans TaxID=227924 RepID=A0A511RK79_9DEIN|nr:ABC transporter ATP-binding protein [Oceanithermus desulfurans]MBB6030516.1 ABC-2 type transport system ATP-binding protein [Oceanithermus desulfurans]GEM90074.1 hypothetical protein ODE01S_15080 [Oceanithermus desulfurans NBRC 100063]
MRTIEVHELKKTFSSRQGWFGARKTERALDGVSFYVDEGETYALLGPNGSGKSTLIRILATLLLPDGGRVRVLGRPLPGGEAEVRRRIGRVSVDAAFYKKLSARENLLYAAQLYGLEPATAGKKALSILERLGLEARRYHDPLEEMSRGMQQKVAIARALLHDPPLLLLDEPTTGLDPASKREVQRFLEELRSEQGTTILLTTHDMAEAERLAARIGFLARGRLVAEGSADALMRQADAADLEEAFIRLTGDAIQKPETEEVV